MRKLLGLPTVRYVLKVEDWSFRRPETLSLIEYRLGWFGAKEVKRVYVQPGLRPLVSWMDFMLRKLKRPLERWQYVLQEDFKTPEISLEDWFAKLRKERDV